MTKDSLAARPFLLLGFVLGLLAAIGMLIWTARHHQGAGDGEGEAWNAVVVAVVLGFPFNLGFSVVVDWAAPAIHRVPGLNILHGLALGIVFNWTLLGLILDRVRISVKRRRASG